jgi:hypothetical protein
MLDNGKIAEVGVPKDLYVQGVIFRGMCERSSITLEDIHLARKERVGEFEFFRFSFDCNDELTRVGARIRSSGQPWQLSITLSNFLEQATTGLSCN